MMSDKSDIVRENVSVHSLSLKCKEGQTEILDLFWITNSLLETTGVTSVTLCALYKLDILQSLGTADKPAIP